jgi:hypothetical protein
MVNKRKSGYKCEPRATPKEIELARKKIEETRNASL